MKTNVIDITEKLAIKTAAFLMNDNLVIGDAELIARLSHFPESQVEAILQQSKKLKGVA